MTSEMVILGFGHGEVKFEESDVVSVNVLCCVQIVPVRDAVW